MQLGCLVDEWSIATNAKVDGHQFVPQGAAGQRSPNRAANNGGYSAMGVSRTRFFPPEVIVKSLGHCVGPAPNTHFLTLNKDPLIAFHFLPERF